MAQQIKPAKSSMKKINIIMSIICLVLFLITLFIVYGLKFENTSPGGGSKEVDFWVEGMGNIFLFTLHFIFNGIFCLIALLVLLVTGIRRKALGNIHSIINLIWLLGSIFLPCMVMLRYN